MAFLIELVQGSKSRAERWRQAAALMGLRSILLCKHQAVREEKSRLRSSADGVGF